jgi:hypothetical protein
LSVLAGANCLEAPDATDYTAAGDESDLKTRFISMNNWLESPLQTPDQTARRLACSGCGTVFCCARSEACWCAAETVVLPMPAAGQDCLCQDCLRKAARLHSGDPLS